MEASEKVKERERETKRKGERERDKQKTKLKLEELGASGRASQQGGKSVRQLLLCHHD